MKSGDPDQKEKSELSDFKWSDLSCKHLNLGHQKVRLLYVLGIRILTLCEIK